MPRLSSDVITWACASSGLCCKGWGIGADRETAAALPGRVAGIPRYAGRDVLVEGDPTSQLHHKDLAFVDGQCIFLNPDQRCDIHARFGSEAKPLICRQYPHLAVKTPLGTDITLAYSCPSAAALLTSPLSVEAVEPGPAMAYVKEVPGHYPIQVAPGAPLDWEGQRALEDGARLLITAGSGSPARELAYLRMALASLAVGEGPPRTAARVREALAAPPPPLPVPSRAEVHRLGAEIVAKFLARRRAARPWPGDLGHVERLEAHAAASDGTGAAWREASSDTWGVLRHYLGAKCFGNLLFSTYGVAAAFQTVLLLGLLVRLEAARRAMATGRAVAPPDVVGAVATVERLFPHESGIFDFWSRKGEGSASLVPQASAALILAASPEAISA